MDIRILQYLGMVIVTFMLFIIPIYLCFWLALKKSCNKWHLIQKIAISIPYFSYIYFAGDWVFVFFNLRYVLLTVFLVSVFASIIKYAQNSEKQFRKYRKYKTTFVLIVFLVLVGANIELFSGWKTAEKGINISFPLKEGFVWHGGNSFTINYHPTVTIAPGQKYALDIIKVNNWGNRANGLLPHDFNHYAIYNDTLFSPCDCEVLEIKNDVENTPISKIDTLNPEGNFILLQFQNSIILLAHLNKNSIQVNKGDIVSLGQPIARIGNSGQTSEPHLHIHAIEGKDPKKITTGKGIPIYFDNQFLVRNEIIINE